MIGWIIATVFLIGTNYFSIRDVSEHRDALDLQAKEQLALEEKNTQLDVSLSKTLVEKSKLLEDLAVLKKSKDSLAKARAKLRHQIASKDALIKVLQARDEKLRKVEAALKK